MAAMQVLCLLVVFQALSNCISALQMNKDEYLRLRNYMLYKEYQMRTGGRLKLSDAELRVNNTLMKLKAKELDIARRNVTDFPPAVHFFRAKALIDKSEVFKMVRNMPKGKLTQNALATKRRRRFQFSSVRYTLKTKCSQRL